MHDSHNANLSEAIRIKNAMRRACFRAKGVISCGTRAIQAASFALRFLFSAYRPLHAPCTAHVSSKLCATLPMPELTLQNTDSTDLSESIRNADEALRLAPADGRHPSGNTSHLGCVFKPSTSYCRLSTPFTCTRYERYFIQDVSYGSVFSMPCFKLPAASHAV